MNYRLAVLTHGDSETLELTLRSFYRHVRPHPASVVILRDGAGEVYRPDWAENGFFGHLWDAQIGFCNATKNLWRVAINGLGPKLSYMEATSFVFWLEHDFLFLRQVDLNPMATALRLNAGVAQMTLMRQAVNEREKELGGVVSDHKDRGAEFLTQDSYGWPWLRHWAYFTTNPSLMSVNFMRMNPWPEYEKQCEGKFGIDLRRRNYSFGIWGRGEPWVKHIGERSGVGY